MENEVWEYYGNNINAAETAHILKSCLVALKDNAIKLSDLMDKQDKVFDRILKLLKEVIMDQMYLDTLSVYIDYIADLVEEIEVKLGTKTWNKVRNAIHRKRKKNKKDFEKEELVC
ncbi:hypothetical protein C1645_830156 [Glomus cerebriforme]|uniref:Uncharacterized protein n=1 Tax=Glomus cerebriforme TaxID=658196 RepID=A0A397SPK5_9GLOM|nr:hypothetical protein C1645_830156 [Glomus cerebriforme]